MEIFIYLNLSVKFHEINKYLDSKLYLYDNHNGKAKIAKEDKTISNLTTNSCPDSERKLQNPINGVKTQMWDIKNHPGSFEPYNHLRPTSGNLGAHTQKAFDELVNRIDKRSFDIKSENYLDNSRLKKHMQLIQKEYLKTNDEQTFAKNYNQLCDLFKSYFITEAQGFNLVTAIGIQDISGIKSENITIYVQNFSKIYYDFNSPWLIFVCEKENLKDPLLKKPAKFLRSFLNYLTETLNNINT